MSTAEGPKLPNVLPAGGQVVAVVPQSVEEIFRLSKGIVQSGLAPYALTGKTNTDELFSKGVSAVAVVIMAGAELGLPPMVALRSFTAINGRPALYGDGLINVVRRSGRATKLVVNYTRGKDFRLFVRAGMIPEPENEEEATELKADFLSWPEDDRTGGYCDATRGDTNENKVVIFTVAQAKRAGLWQTETVVEKDVWENGQKVRRKVPNDSPWFRYPERMLGWRAAGFCLRELFGDVLGGITDDWEAREIGGMIDITPPTSNGRPTPPPPPAEEDENQDPDQGAKAEVVEPEQDAEEGKTLAEMREEREAETAQEPAQDATKAAPAATEQPETATPPAPPPPPEDDGSVPDTSDAGRFLDQIEETLATAGDQDMLDRLWDELEVQNEFSSDEDALERAFALKKKHEERITRVQAVAAGQTSFLDDVPEETRQAVKNAGTP
jgi:hypothetical protein